MRIFKMMVMVVAVCWSLASSGQVMAGGCGGSSAQYRLIGAINHGACGISSALKLTSLKVGGRVKISPAATTSCRVSSALVRWFKGAVQPAARKHFGSKVVKIHNISSYACRSRPSGKLSEHGKANAIDIKGFTLANGQFVSVLNHWYSGGAKGAFLQTVHRKACGTFKTVLGPRANAAHRDHFHLDMAHYRSGSYCR